MSKMDFEDLTIPTEEERKKLAVLKEELYPLERKLFILSSPEEYWKTKEYKKLEKKMEKIGKQISELTKWGYNEFQCDCPWLKSSKINLNSTPYQISK